MKGTATNECENSSVLCQINSYVVVYVHQPFIINLYCLREYGLTTNRKVLVNESSIFTQLIPALMVACMNVVDDVH